MWNVIAVTCPVASQLSALENELDLYQKKGIIPQETIILTIEDPGNRVGSGSATFNALLVVAEHLSAKNGYQIITSDILHTSRIAIFLHGRNFPYDPCGKTFLTLPVSSDANNSQNPSRLVSNFECLLQRISKLAFNSEPGVWVCSTDMILQGDMDRNCVLPKDCHAVLFASLEDIDYATDHGVIHIDSQDNSVINILYAGRREMIEQFSVEKNKVAVVAGIVFLSTAVAESLLSLHVISPMDSCTYMGQDSGTKPLQVSLYFDILIAMGNGITEDAYVSGDYCKSYNEKHDYSEDLVQSTKFARQLVWKELNKYRMKTYIMKDVRYRYLSELINANTYCSILKSSAESNLIHHSYIKESKMPDTNSAVIINSHVEFVNFGSDVVVQHCHLRGKQNKPISIGDSTYLLGVHADNEKSSFFLKDRMVLIETTIQLEVSGSMRPKRIFVIFGISDLLPLPSSAENATICNIPWNEFFRNTGIKDEDLWPNANGDSSRTLMNARLFPVNVENIQSLSWLQSLDKSVPTKIIERWRRATRFSIENIMTHSALALELTVHKQLYCHVTTKLIQRILKQNEVQSLIPYFKCSVVEGWHSHLRNTMDLVACSFDHKTWEPDKGARTLACIADLLGCMAADGGGLRSGPAANKSWTTAFEMLEAGNKGSIARGVKALSSECENWLDTPTKLTRAARHYEGAAQILIRHAVMTAKESVHLDPFPLPSMNQWFTAECPARVDLQGGWSDTPPICYELGGSVVNLALLIEEKRPIGAKAMRTEELQLELVLGKDEDNTKRIVIRHLEELMNYRQLTIAGALLKAAIICAEVVDVHTEQTLQEQLAEKYSSGITVQCWSKLPEGSGLGTSSILAGAIIAVLWTVTGKKWDRLSLIHAVLCLEQMLTTGGGWQDQVAGIMGGVNFASSPACLPIKVEVDRLELSAEFEQELNNHLLLVYTGKVRLAKNLLQNVIRNWYARNNETVYCFQSLVSNARACKQAFDQRNLPAIGDLLNKYWQQKITIAPGCDPIAIREMMAALKPYVYGQTLAGAGGGGFIFMLTKQPNMQDKIHEILQELPSVNQVTIYPAVIDMHGIDVSGH